MMTEELKDLIRYRMEQAQDALDASKLLFGGGLHRDSVNRSYYAMFYAVLALLATKALGTSKHSGAISLFDREFMRPGLLPRDLSQWLHEAFQERLKADYGAPAQVSDQDARRLLREAGDFVAAIRAYLADQAAEPR